MTSEQESAFLALTGEAGTFVTAELLLTLAIEHCCEGLLTDISQAVVWKYKMIAAVDIAVGLHRCSPSAGG